MLFHEIYGRYFNAVAQILTEACEGRLTCERLRELSFKKGFAESILNIPQSLTSGKWALLTEDLKTPLTVSPKLPLTKLQRRWLKTVIRDKKMRLFLDDEELERMDEELGDVEPFFFEEDDIFVYYDKYLDGDYYESPDYIQNFRNALKAIKEQKLLKLRFVNGRGKEKKYFIHPEKIEYSVKDDKFRIISKAHPLTVNIGRIIYSEVVDDYHRECRILKKARGETVRNDFKEAELFLTDVNAALERAMLHFSHFEKETERVDDKHYKIFIKYYPEYETELIIRILSFGQHIKAVSPDDFVSEIRRRIEKQFMLTEK